MGTKPHTPAGHAVCALIVALTAAGCSEPDRPDGPDGSLSGRSAASTPAPQKSSPADICTNIVSYWAKEMLKGGKWAGLDWEQKGLSNEQYAIHEEVVAAARAEEKRQGPDAALKLIDTRTREKCTAAKGATGSSENWRDPR
jgi:hypothetical protein